MFELKVGRRRRSVIIPGGKAQNDWKVFGLELRKMLDPDHYAFGGSGKAKFVFATEENVRASSLLVFC